MVIHAASHAAELRDVGFTVVAAEISPMLLSAARIEACSALDSMLAQIDAVPDPKAYSPRSAGAFSFREIVHRAPQRYDFRISDDGCFSKVCDEATTCATSILIALHDLPLHPHDHDLRTSWVRRVLPFQPRAIMSGIVTSLPGASVQNFHADGSPMHFALAARVPRHRLVQVFFPLVDIPKDSIGTQFWAGSHLSRREREFWRWKGVSSLLEADASAMASMSSPACPAGSIIIFDYTASSIEGLVTMDNLRGLSGTRCCPRDWRATGRATGASRACGTRRPFEGAGLRPRATLQRRWGRGNFSEKGWYGKNTVCVSRGSGWSVPCVSIQLTLSQRARRRKEHGDSKRPCSLFALPCSCFYCTFFSFFIVLEGACVVLSLHHLTCSC